MLAIMYLSLHYIEIVSHRIHVVTLRRWCHISVLIQTLVRMNGATIKL